jgi:hypothetical protein
MPYEGKNKLKPGEKFLACVWGPGDFSISKRKGFKTFEGLERFAKKLMEGNDGVHEVTVLVKDKSNPDFPWKKIHTFENEYKARIREAAKREACEKKQNKRTK